MADLVHDLAGPEIEVEETHISWVFLGAEEVWKVKKPVNLGFVDFSTPEKRREACEAEVSLNRRLAADVYREVVPVTRDDDGGHRLGGAGTPVDWAVRMRRLPAERRADHLLGRGRLGVRRVEALARRILRFHRLARCDGETSSFGTREVIAANVDENFAQTRDSIARYLTPREAREIESWQRSFLEERGELLAERVAAGKVRDGHGDLRLEHVYFEDDSVTVVDCVEFNDRFRYADVCADIAFLSMDLSWHGRVDLAERFLAAYAQAGGDYDLYPLVDFYESYRAWVRGKVSDLVARSEETALEVRERASEEARRYFRLALAAERRTLLDPVVVAVGGVIAAGKSTVAERLAARLGAPVVDSDRTRKQLLGMSPNTPHHVSAWEGGYDPEVTERVYAELRRRAQAVLDSGRPVVVDASFRSAGERRRTREAARQQDVPFFFVECRADPATCKERLRRRRREAGVSDGRLEIFDDFAAAWEPVTELPEGEHLVADTSLPLEGTLTRLERRLPVWPPGLTE